MDFLVCWFTAVFSQELVFYKRLEFNFILYMQILLVFLVQGKEESFGKYISLLDEAKMHDTAGLITHPFYFLPGELQSSISPGLC